MNARRNNITLTEGQKARARRRRKKYIRNRIICGSVICMLLIILTGSVVYALEQNSPEKAPAHEYIRVEEGDSLWSIARKNFPYDDTRQIIYEIQKLNNMSDASIYAGDLLLLPAK